MVVAPMTLAAVAPQVRAVAPVAWAVLVTPAPWAAAVVTPKVQDMATLLRLLVRASTDIMDTTTDTTGMARVLLGLPLVQVIHHLLAVVPAKH